MEDAHPEGDRRAGDPDNGRQRVEAVPPQHHRHPRGGRRLGTQVRRWWCPWFVCPRASVAIAVSQSQEPGAGGLLSHCGDLHHSIRVRIWNF